jgi:hypothetical protein
MSWWRPQSKTPIGFALDLPLFVLPVGEDRPTDLYICVVEMGLTCLLSCAL